jgi:hypothetical protein
MTETPPARSTLAPETASAQANASHSRRASPEVTGWVGWVFFAGLMLIMVGIFQAIDGLVALFKDEYYVVRADGLVVNVNYTAWGWTHLIIGALLVLVGLGLLMGQTWARVAGIILATLSAIANFAFIAAYPFWSIMIITIDVLVIYALAAHGKEVRAARELG